MYICIFERLCNWCAYILWPRLPSWIRAMVPKIFYITEKAWNYYPTTITEYTCSFVPSFAIHIETKYLNDKGTTDNVSLTFLPYLKKKLNYENFSSMSGWFQCLELPTNKKDTRVVEVVDIVNDKVADHHYKEAEDLTRFKSSVTNRGPLDTDWLEKADPVMCSYKSVEVTLDLWAFQSRIEEYIHKVTILIGKIRFNMKVLSWCRGMAMDLCLVSDSDLLRIHQNRISPRLFVLNKQDLKWLSHMFTRPKRLFTFLIPSRLPKLSKFSCVDKARPPIRVLRTRYFSVLDSFLWTVLY